MKGLHKSFYYSYYNKILLLAKKATSAQRDIVMKSSDKNILFGLRNTITKMSVGQFLLLSAFFTQSLQFGYFITIWKK